MVGKNSLFFDEGYEYGNSKHIECIRWSTEAVLSWREHENGVETLANGVGNGDRLPAQGVGEWSEFHVDKAAIT